MSAKTPGRLRRPAVFDDAQSRRLHVTFARFIRARAQVVDQSRCGLQTLMFIHLHPRLVCGVTDPARKGQLAFIERPRTSAAPPVGVTAS